MNREAKEKMPIEQLIQSLIDAAKRGEWEMVDEQLVPQLTEFDGNQMVQELLSHVDDEDSDVRDVVATGLAALEIPDVRMKREAIERMIIMATEDEERFPAGRAAVFLLKHRRDRDFGGKAEDALVVFRRNVRRAGWVKDLKENIPQLGEILD